MAPICVLLQAQKFLALYEVHDYMKYTHHFCLLQCLSDLSEYHFKTKTMYLECLTVLTKGPVFLQGFLSTTNRQ